MKVLGFRRESSRFVVPSRCLSLILVPRQKAAMAIGRMFPGGRKRLVVGMDSSGETMAETDLNASATEETELMHQHHRLAVHLAPSRHAHDHDVTPGWPAGVHGQEDQTAVRAPQSRPLSCRNAKARPPAATHKPVKATHTKPSLFLFGLGSTRYLKSLQSNSHRLTASADYISRRVSRSWETGADAMREAALQFHHHQAGGSSDAVGVQLRLQ